MFWSKRVYLDQAAGRSGNPSSPHEEGRRAKEALESARVSIARLLEVQADDIIFTSGATESNALLILGHIRALKEGGRKDIHILYLPSAHASLAHTVELAAHAGVSAEPLPIQEGRVDIEGLKRIIRESTALIAMEAVCGETGVVWNTRDVAHAIAGKNIMLHVDASQAPHTEKITRAHFGAQTLTLDASKVSSVRGIGLLVAHRTIPLAPLYGGGGQERGLRPGSEAPELAVRFAAGLADTAGARDAFRRKSEAMRKEVVALLAKRIPDMLINEARAQAPHILNVSLKGRNTDYVVALLDEAGFAVSTRSACETDSQEGSRAVYALFGDKDRARSTLRVSWGPGVSSNDLSRFAHALHEAVAFIDMSAGR